MTELTCSQRGVGVCLATALVVCAVATASVIAPKDLKSLSVEADAIIVGQCKDVRSYWNGKRIFTDAVVEPQQSVKGTLAAGEPVTLTHLGGTMDEPLPVQMVVPDAPRFEPGETLLLFVYEGPSSRQALGWTQGKLLVVEQDGVRRVRTQNLPAGSPMSEVDGRALEDVLAEIEGYLQAAAQDGDDKEVQR